MDDGGTGTRRRALEMGAVFAGVGISVVFGWFAVRGVKIGAAWGALRSTNYWWLVPSLAALAISVFLRVVRWQVLFRPDRRPPLAVLAKATLLGYFFNSILPVRAGEAARIVALKHYAGTSRAETTATVVLERVFDVSSLIVLLFAFAAWLPRVSWLAPAAAVAGACVLIVVLLVFAVRHLPGRPMPAVLKLLSRLPGLREETVLRLTDNAVHGLATLARPRQALIALAWTFMSWWVLALSFWFLMIGFDLELSPFAGLLVVIATGLAFIIPAAPAAVGVFEAAGLASLSAYGVQRSHAFAYVLSLHLLNFVPFVGAGLLLLGDEAGLRRAGRPVASRLRSRR